MLVSIYIFIVIMIMSFCYHVFFIVLVTHIFDSKKCTLVWSDNPSLAAPREPKVYAMT